MTATELRQTKIIIALAACLAEFPAAALTWIKVNSR